MLLAVGVAAAVVVVVRVGLRVAVRVGLWVAVRVDVVPVPVPALALEMIRRALRFSLVLPVVGVLPPRLRRHPCPLTEHVAW